MATDWRDVIRRGGTRPAATPVFDAAPAAPPQTPAMAKLLADRAALEARMAALTGNSADAARYPVQPMAARRADHRRWETARETRQQSLAERRPATPAPAPRRTPAPPPTPGGTPVEPRRWYAQHDAARARTVSKPVAKPAPAPVPKPAPALAVPAEKPRKPVAVPAAAKPPAERPRGKITPVKPVARVNPVAEPARARAKPVPEPIRKAAQKPEDPLGARDAARARAPRATPETRPRAAARPDPAPRPPPAREPARPFGSDLRRAITDTLDRPVARKAIEKIGADRIAKPKEKIQKPLEKARNALDGANRAVRTLSDAWDKRRDLIAGPDLDRYTKGYDARKAQLLGVETGSLNDLAERTERQRQAGIARRAETRRAETADENRRARARENRIEQRKADRG